MNGDNPFTVAVCFKPTRNTDFEYLLSQYKDGDESSAFNLAIFLPNNSDDRAVRIFVDTDIDSWYATTSGTPLRLNDWNYLVWTWRGYSHGANASDLYMNNNLSEETMTTDAGSGTVNDSDGRWSIGGRITESNWFEGYIEYVAIWDSWMGNWPNAQTLLKGTSPLKVMNNHLVFFTHLKRLNNIVDIINGRKVAGENLTETHEAPPISYN